MLERCGHAAAAPTGWLTGVGQGKNHVEIHGHRFHPGRIVVLKTYGFTGASAKGAGWTSAGWITHGLSLSAALLTAFGTLVAHQKEDAHVYMLYVHTAHIHS